MPSLAPSTLATFWPLLASDFQTKPCLCPAGCSAVAAATSGVSASKQEKISNPGENNQSGKLLEERPRQMGVLAPSGERFPA